MKKILFVVLLLSSEVEAQSYYALRSAFFDRKTDVASMDLTFVDETAQTRTYDFVLHTTGNDSLTGRLRMPRSSKPSPAALLCVGIETGKGVIAMIEGQENVLLMAIDYPFEGEMDFRGFAAVGTVFRLRTMAFRTVPLLLTALDWLFSMEAVDQSDVTVVAVSFGSFTAIPAAVIDQRVKQLAVVQGGGDLSTVIESNAERLHVPISSALAGWLGGAILAPFEPNKYIAHLAPRFLFMVNSEGDTMFPKASALALYEAASEPKELLWHTSKHVAPGERALIQELTNIVVQRLYGESSRE